MGKAIAAALCGVFLTATTLGVSAQERPHRPATVDERLRFYVDNLMKTQKEDGHWEHGYELGMTGLAVLALKHSNDPRAATAVAKGVEYIINHTPEYKTYSAGTIISALYQVDPRTHRETIRKYASLLARSQLKGKEAGMYGYNLAGGEVFGRGDNSNTQFAVLGLLYAQRADHKIPKSVWENLRKHYIKTQNPDGGWAYRTGGKSTHNMTLAGAVSLYIAEEQLALGSATEYVMTSPSRATEAAMKWIATHFTTDLGAYGLYALERLGILTGRSEFGGHYWHSEGSKRISRGGASAAGSWGQADTAFLILFLSRGKEPIIINKLKYYGDWDNSHYGVKHITDYISDRMQSPMQWRVVTLESKLDDLLKVPILHYSGIKGPQFSRDEKVKIRNYVLKGGVLMAQACNSEGAEEFDEAFRALMEECFPEAKLKELPATHDMFQTPRHLKNPPEVEVIRLKQAIGVIYLSKALTLDWHRGDAGAKPALDAGINIIFHVLKQAGRLGAGTKPIRG